MKTFVKAALGALVLAPVALAATTEAQARVGVGIYLGVPGPYAYPAPYPYPARYADPCYDPRVYGPDPYCAYPYYNGPVFVGGSWYNGPIRHRDFHGARQFWVHGGWHAGRAGHAGHR